MKNNRLVGVERTETPVLRRPDDVLIRVAVAGLCRTDVYIAEGRVKAPDRLILGHEFSGIVAAAGPEAQNVKTGDRVCVMPLFPRSNDNMLAGNIPSYANSTMLGVDHDGAFSEYVVVPASSVYRLPQNISFKQGAYMEPVAASLAVLNAAVARDAKGLVYGDNRISRLTERVMRAGGFTDLDVCEDGEVLAPDSYDFIVETLATTETMAKMVEAVKPGGRIILKSRQHTPVAFNINKLVMKDITLQAVGYGRFQDGIDLIASGKLKVDDLFGDVFPLEQFEKVFEESKRGESRKLFFSAADPDVWDR